MKNNEIHSAASAKRRWSKKDDFSVDFSECPRRTILSNAMAFFESSQVMRASLGPLLVLAILFIFPRIFYDLFHPLSVKL